MSLMPTSRRSRQPLSRRYRSFTEYASLAAAEPVTVEVETALTSENEGQPAGVEEVTLTPGTARWRGIVGFENEMTGDGRIIAEGALRWPEDLAENPIPIRYVSSDVGAHDGAVVVGLIDTLERQAPLENGSIPIYGEGVFDDDENATVAQEAFRLVDKKMTNGVSMDLDDVAFEVQNDGDQETVSTHDARIRAVTIVAIPAFANARIGLFSPEDSVEKVVTEVTELSDSSPKLERAAELISEHNEVVRTNSSRGMRAHAITKAKLKRLASRSTTFAYQTTKIKDPEGNWVETPASAIDIASNSTPPDDSFEKGLAILNEADMLELGSEEYLAKVREAVPLFQEASDDGGDRGPDAKKVLEILESYLSIDWPTTDDSGEAVTTDGAEQSSENVEKAAEEVTSGENSSQKAAAETTTLAGATETLAFNPDQWRNPSNGQWIDMPGRILGRLDAFYDADSESGELLGDAKGKGTEFIDKLNDGDVQGAIDDLDEISELLEGLDDENTAANDEASEALQSATDGIEKLKTVDWFSAPTDGEGVGSFDEPEAEEADPFEGVTDTALMRMLENGNIVPGSPEWAPAVQEANRRGLLTGTGDQAATPSSTDPAYVQETRQTVADLEANGGLQIPEMIPFLDALSAGDTETAAALLAKVRKERDRLMGNGDPNWGAYQRAMEPMGLAMEAHNNAEWEKRNAPAAPAAPAPASEGNITDPDGSKRAERKAEQDAENEAADLRIAAAEAKGSGGLDMAPLENLIEGWINRGVSGEQIEDRLVGRLGEENRAAVHDYLTNDGGIIWEGGDEDSTEPETAIEEGLQAMEQLEIEFDQDIPTEASQALNALDADDIEDAEKSLVEVQKQLQDAQDGYLGDDDVEGETRIRFLGDIVDALSRTIDRWKSEKSYNEGREFAYDPAQSDAWAKEFNVPDAQVEDILSALAVKRGTDEWEELSSAAQGFVSMAQAGVDVHDALAIYLRTLEEFGHGSKEITLGARRGQVFNWVDEVGGLPAYIRSIADSLMTKQGFSESRAIATAVETVKRWSKGGPARKGGKGNVSAATVAKAAKALAEWESKKARANATAAETVVLANEDTALVASGGWGTPYATTKERAHSDSVAKNRRELLARVRGEDVVAEAEAITAAASGNALAVRPTVKLNSKSKIPVAPPKKWFENPGLTEPTPVTIDEDGRVYGHLASWNVCHVASPAGEGVCIMAPKSRTGYAYFHTGAVKTAEGDLLATGRLCMNGMHAKSTLGYAATMAHYDDTSLAVADVRVGEDRYGIWVAGAMRPDVTEKQIRTFRASPVSGDWRKIGGNLELTIGLNVNAPGYPVPRPMGLVASIGGDSEAEDHELISLVAAGMLPPVDAPEPTLSPSDIKYLQSLAAQMKNQETLANRERVEALAAKMKAQKARAQVAAFAAKRATMVTTTEGSN